MASGVIFFSRYFNPRSREGSDIFDQPHIAWFAISIHAPAKGATELTESMFSDSCISIHAPAKGATWVTA